MAKPGVAAPILGIRQIEQLAGNLLVLTTQFTADQLAALEAVFKLNLFCTPGLKRCFSAEKRSGMAVKSFSYAMVCFSLTEIN
ncbi:hypothetical protein [Spirosoma aerophilum]